MRYDLSQAELVEAVEYYLNEKILRNPVKVSEVAEQECRGSGSYLNVTVTTEDPAQGAET